jgi:hypothetical protein
VGAVQLNKLSRVGLTHCDVSTAIAGTLISPGVQKRESLDATGGDSHVYSMQVMYVRLLLHVYFGLQQLKLSPAVWLGAVPLQEAGVTTASAFWVVHCPVVTYSMTLHNTDRHVSLGCSNGVFRADLHHVKVQEVGDRASGQKAHPGSCPTGECLQDKEAVSAPCYSHWQCQQVSHDPQTWSASSSNMCRI